MKPQINFWFLRTHDSTIYGNYNVSKFFPRGRRIWDEFNFFFCMHDPCTDPKSYAAKHSLFKVNRMLQHLQRKFELYWDPAHDLITNDQTIGFQGRHKDNIWITFKDACDGFQANAVCDCVYTYYLIYRNDDIPDSKHYLSATSERFIWLLKRLKIEWNHVYMDNLYNNIKLCRVEYTEKKPLHDAARTHGRGVPYEIIHQEVKSKGKQYEVRGAVKVAVMKGDATCPDVLACSLYDTNPVHII